MAQIRSRFSNVRIVSDGTARGTRILNNDTGDELIPGTHFRSLTWQVEAGRIARVTVELTPAVLEVTGELAEATVQMVEE